MLVAPQNLLHIQKATMKSKHTLRVIAAAVLSIVSVPTALAQYSDSYYYLGGGIGKARVEINDERVTRPLFGSGLTATNINRDNHDTNMHKVSAVACAMTAEKCLSARWKR